jgi:hypothetical protein
MRLDQPEKRQSEYARQRTAPGTAPGRSNTGMLVVIASVVIALALAYLASLPSGAPNSGSTSTSAEVDPAASVQSKDTPAPGINPDGR